jgi:hypothetical protein
MIFNNTKVSRKHSLKTQVLTKVLRLIFPDIDTEVTKHKDPYLSKELVNKEQIQENQGALKSCI